MNAVAATGAIDALYRRAVEDPGALDDAALEEWMGEAVDLTGPDREALRALRAAVRLARKLARHHAARGGRHADWRHGVDEALGSGGWEPQLDLVRRALGVEPTPEVFAAMKQRHRAVHFTEWMEGVGYEEWRSAR